MNWNQKIIVFIAIVIIAGVPSWLSTYTQYLNNTLFSIYAIAVTAISAGILAFKTKDKKRYILLYTMGAHQVAFIIKMIIDCSADPTNHNMAPFEMIILIIADGIFSTITAIAGETFRKASKA